MILNAETVTPEIREESIQVAERVFATSEHPDQMQATRANFERLKSLSPDSILYEVTDNGKLAGWVVAMPTSKELAEKFVNKEIGEQILLEETEHQDQYDALYLCAAATLSEYRRQGIATNLVKEAILRMPLRAGYELYAWPTTPEGSNMVKKLEKETGKVIRQRV